MSVQVMTWVFEHSRSEHAERLVLLSLANHAGGDGGDAYPSIPTIASETRLGESTVRGALERLKAMGELVEVGVSPLRTRCFRLVMTPAESAPPQKLRPRRNERQAPQKRAPNAPDSAPETSVEPSGNRPPTPPDGGRTRDRSRFQGEVGHWIATELRYIANDPRSQDAVEQAIVNGGARTKLDVERFLSEWWPQLGSAEEAA